MQLEVPICRAETALQKAIVTETQAKEANAKAEGALNKAGETQKQVLEARRDVLEVAQAVTEIAAILPRTGRFGGGLSDTDTALLKKNVDLLQNKIKKLRTQ